MKKSSYLFFLVSFKITYFSNFLACIGCIGYLPKLKRGMGLIFTADSSHTFSIKILLENYIKSVTLSNDQVSIFAESGLVG